MLQCASRWGRGVVSSGGGARERLGGRWGGGRGAGEHQWTDDGTPQVRFGSGMAWIRLIEMGPAHESSRRCWFSYFANLMTKAATFMDWFLYMSRPGQRSGG